jgi:hypothetical protein
MKKMLSLDGWAVGIAYTSKVIIDIIWFIFIIYKARKRKIVFLYYPAITMITFAFAYTFFMADFISILLLGNNFPLRNIHIHLFVTLLFVGILSFCSVGMILTYPRKKKILITGSILYIIFLYIIAAFLPNFGFTLVTPSVSGEHLQRLYLDFNSIMIYLYIPLVALIFSVAINFLTKTAKLKGKLRRKYLSLTITNFLASVWWFVAFCFPDFGIIFAIVFILLNLLVWSTLYYGLTPVKEKQSKKG